MFNLYKVVKNKLRGECGDLDNKLIEENKQQPKTNTESKKVDRSILDLAERGEINEKIRSEIKNGDIIQPDCHHAGVASGGGTAITKNTYEIKKEIEDSPPKRKILKPTRFFTADSKTKQLSNGQVQEQSKK